MSHNPNYKDCFGNEISESDMVYRPIKSQHELNTCNDGKRSSDVLLSTIEELEKTKLQLEIALTGLKTIKNMEFERYLMANGWIAVDKMRETAKTYIKQIEDLNK